MKRQAFSLISLLTLLLVAGSAIAQTVHVRADIPFNFAVGNKTLQPELTTAERSACEIARHAPTPAIDRCSFGCSTRLL